MDATQVALYEYNNNRHGRDKFPLSVFLCGLFVCTTNAAKQAKQH